MTSARIPASELALLRQADDVLRDAQAASKRMRDEAEVAASEHLQRAIAEGIARGRREGIVAILGVVEFEQRLFSILIDRFVDMVDRCVRSILGDLGDASVMRSRVEHLLRKSASPPVSLYVHPDQEALARQALSEIDASRAFAGISIVVDAQRPHGSLLLETSTDYAEASIEMSIEELRTLLRQALVHAIHMRVPLQ